MAYWIQIIEDKVFNKHEIPDSGLTIGRSVKNDIYLNDPSVSQQHARVEVKQLTDGAKIYFIRDLNSTNHTYVNGEPVEEYPLSHGDEINIGTNLFRFLDEENEKLELTKAFKKSWIPGMYYLDDK